MHNYLLLPVFIIKFWYVEAPYGIVAFFISLNKAFLEMFSLPLFLRTFFQPLKNEYRQGLVGFSRGMGMAIKSIFILVDLFLLVVLVAFEIVTVIGFLAFPLVTVALLFYG